MPSRSPIARDKEPRVRGRALRTDRMYFSVDRPGDLNLLRRAEEILRFNGFTRHHSFAYVLIGYDGDTEESAKERIQSVWDAGFMPFAMLYRAGDGLPSPEWRDFQRCFARPALTRRMLAASLEQEKCGCVAEEAGKDGST